MLKNGQIWGVLGGPDPPSRALHTALPVTLVFEKFDKIWSFFIKNAFFIKIGKNRKKFGHFFVFS
jgi:hypothetical protein